MALRKNFFVAVFITSPLPCKHIFGKNAFCDDEIREAVSP